VRMTPHTGARPGVPRTLFLAALLLAAAPALRADSSAAPADPDPAPTPAAVAAQEPAPAETKAHLDIYGFAMLDMGYETKQSDPNWFDVARPTKLPSHKDEFGADGQGFAGVRQSRLGVKAFMPTSLGELKTIFEFELFGTGVDAGQTTFRLRHAWGEIGALGAGQTWSPFMDPDVFPNSVEYWGPNGMVFFRNVQLRYTPWRDGDSRVAIAVERPGASADQGIYAGRIELEGVKARFPVPDISGHFRLASKWGHFQVAGIYRYMKWTDLNATAERDLSGKAMGWGVNVSSNIKVQKHVARLQVVYGKGIENYMNDAPVDIGIETDLTNTFTPVKGKPLPVLGIVAFMDLNWNERFTSTAGYSYVGITNSGAQADSAFKRGYYALANVLFHPTSRVFLGPEVQWVRRVNYNDGWKADDLRFQFSAKFNFDYGLGGK
jgi:hypothetical protein